MQVVKMGSGQAEHHQHSVYTCTAVCSPLYIYLTPAWPQQMFNLHIFKICNRKHMAELLRRRKSGGIWAPSAQKDLRLQKDFANPTKFFWKS